MTPRIERPAALLGALLILGACSQGGGGVSHATAAQRQACRQRADEVYSLQNRGAVYQSDQYVSSLRDAPFGGAGLPANPTMGLSGEYSRDRLERSCIDGLATAPSAATDAGQPQPLTLKPATP